MDGNERCAQICYKDSYNSPKDTVDSDLSPNSAFSILENDNTLFLGSLPKLLDENDVEALISSFIGN